MEKKKMNNSEDITIDIAKSQLFRKLIQAEEENKRLRLENSKLLDHLFKLQSQLDVSSKRFNDTISEIRSSYRELRNSHTPDSIVKALHCLDDILFIYNSTI